MKKLLLYGLILGLLVLGTCDLFTNNGTLNLRITDEPLILEDGRTVESIMVTIKEIKVSRGTAGDDLPEDTDIEVTGEEVDPEAEESTAEWITLSNEDQSYNLMDLVDGATELLGSAELEAGRYNQLRLIVDENNTITFTDDTEVYDLKIPSGTESGVKLTGGFYIKEDLETEILVDFDAAQSVHYVADQYILQPTIKIIKVKKAQKGNS